MSVDVSLDFGGVFPAITTPFLSSGGVDLGFVQKHIAWLYQHGCHGVVPCGSLGEGATLSFKEKLDIMKACLEVDGAKPVIPGIAALSTAEAVELARAAEGLGCQGLMVLPPYAYSTDWREMKAHITTVIGATSLPVILYNNPVAYKTDFSPRQILELAQEFPQIKAVKESSTDVRRIMSIREIMDGRLTLMMGVDDAIVEGIRMGVTGWVAGLVNAFPAESVALWRWALSGEVKKADELYKWFLPLLRLDTVPKFVQLIKLVQAEVGMGSELVRPPRLKLAGEERAEALAVIRTALSTGPAL